MDDDVVTNAQWLGVQGCEDLFAVCALAQLRLWRALGGTPDPQLDDLLAAHSGRRRSLEEVADTHRGQRLT